MNFLYPEKPTRATEDFLSLVRENEHTCQQKLNGWRAQIHIGPEIKLFTRTGLPLEQKAKVPPSIIRTLKDLSFPAKTVLDAEFVGPRGGYKPFLGLFDCLAWGGKWLTKQPYSYRWSLIRHFRFSEEVKLVESVDADFLGYYRKLKKEWQETGCELVEGVVLKRLENSPLALRRKGSSKSGHMFKVRFVG